jgi:hypothetical protein
VNHNEETFRDLRVALDGNEYRGCKFIKCVLVYSGGTPPVLVDNLMTHCRWEFEGAAIRTVSFMAAIYRGAGEGGRKLIEDAFASIRSGK